MNKISSISLLFVGVIFLLIGIYIGNIYIRYPALFVSIVLSVMAAFRSFEEKRNKNL